MFDELDQQLEESSLQDGLLQVIDDPQQSGLAEQLSVAQDHYDKRFIDQRESSVNAVAQHVPLVGLMLLAGRYLIELRFVDFTKLDITSCRRLVHQPYGLGDQAELHVLLDNGIVQLAAQVLNVGEMSAHKVSDLVVLKESYLFWRANLPEASMDSFGKAERIARNQSVVRADELPQHVQIVTGRS